MRSFASFHDTVPRRLSDHLTSFSRDHPNSRNLLYSVASGLVITEYLHVLASEWQNEFLMRKRDANGIQWQFSARKMSFADALFSLRLEPGFFEITRRLKYRDLKVAFREAQAAATFAKQGFLITCRPETGVRGADFDFSASIKEDTINVEVTQIQETLPNVATFHNCLKRKRDQFPAGQLACLVIYVDPIWFEDIIWHEKLFSVAKEFFARSGRICYIIIMREVFRSFTDGGQIFISSNLVTNGESRLFSRAVDDAINSQPTNVLFDSVENAMTLDEVSRVVRSDLLEWADWCAEGQP